MAAERTYLDYNATAPLRAATLNACLSSLAVFGNPSSVHREGQAARALVETARRQVARLLGASTDHVVFTSGGTEGANWLLQPGLRKGSERLGRLIVGTTEHACVLQGHRFESETVTSLPVSADGIIDLDVLRRSLRDNGPALVALQAANNETGVVQPVRAAADVVHAAGGLLICDAVQAVGRVPFSLAESGADALFVSGHKLGGPKGTGAVAWSDSVEPGSLLRGGGQERGLRSGTENVPGVAGFGATAEEVQATDDGDRLRRLRDLTEVRVCALRDDVAIFGEGAPRLPNTSCFAVPGTRAETLLMALDLEGIAVSSGSACSSGKVARSPVLAAMGIPPDVGAGAIRVSFGWGSTEADVDRFVEGFTVVMQRMQRRSMPRAA